MSHKRAALRYDGRFLSVPKFGGEISNFNKLVSRARVEDAAGPRTRAPP
jgi:hypothetical protein